MTTPLVSVVIPVYNAARFVRETLESVFAQSCRDFEVVCSDDGSTDDSVAVITNVASAHRQAVHVVSHHRGGQTMAKNRGATVAKGRYLAFLDADDLWYPRKLQHQVEVLESVPQAVLVHCNYDEIDEAGHPLRRFCATTARGNKKKDLWEQLLGPQAWILNSVMMVRRTAFEQIGGFDPDVGLDDEADFCLRFRSLGKFVYLEEAGAAKRTHQASFSHEGTPADKKFGDGTRFLHKLELRFTNDSEKLRLVHLLLASRYSDWGWHKIRTGDSREGLHLLLRALPYDPWRYRTYSRIMRSYMPAALRHYVSKHR